MNILDNGTILPSGLLGHYDDGMLEGFNKTFKNFALRVGIVKNIYPVSDDKNISKLSTEYDVLVAEQNTDKGATTIFYRNCLNIEGMGSKADFFEKTLRSLKRNYSGQPSINASDQNGAIVLLLCMDGLSDKAVVMGSLNHPDRPTTLTTTDPRLEGEYNGVNVSIEPDGSTKLIFKGATDNDGKIIDSSQGNTIISIEIDGSFQVQNSSTTFRLDKTKGVASLNTQSDANVTSGGDINANASGSVSLNGSGGKVKLSNSKVAIGAGDEVLDLFSQTLQQMVSMLGAIQSLTVPTAVGPSGVPINSGSFSAVQSQISQIKSKLEAIKGTL